MLRDEGVIDDAQYESMYPKAEKRESTGKNESRRLRASGRIPATVYGDGQEAAHHDDRKARHDEGQEKMTVIPGLRTTRWRACQCSIALASAMQAR